MRLSSAISIFPFACCLGLIAQSRVSAINQDGRTILTYRSQGTKWTVTIETHRVTSADESRPLPQCTQSRIPCSVTTNLQVGAALQTLQVPKSAYADLGDMNTAKLEITQSTEILTIIGGDASESYTARLIFHKGLLRKRLLFSGEDLSHPLESTSYFTVSTKN